MLETHCYTLRGVDARLASSNDGLDNAYTSSPRPDFNQTLAGVPLVGRGDKSTNFVGAGYPLDEYRDRISDEQYELESPSKQEKAVVRKMRAQYTSGTAGATARL